MSSNKYRTNKIAIKVTTKIKIIFFILKLYFLISYWQPIRSIYFDQITTLFIWIIPPLVSPIFVSFFVVCAIFSTFCFKHNKVLGHFTRRANLLTSTTKTVEESKLQRFFCSSYSVSGILT